MSTYFCRSHAPGDTFATSAFHPLYHVPYRYQSRKKKRGGDTIMVKAIGLPSIVIYQSRTTRQCRHLELPKPDNFQSGKTTRTMEIYTRARRRFPRFHPNGEGNDSLLLILRFYPIIRGNDFRCRGYHSHAFIFPRTPQTIGHLVVITIDCYDRLTFRAVLRS